MLVFDLESDGLLDDVTCIHCLVIYDSEADKTYVNNDQSPVVYSSSKMLRLFADTTLLGTTYRAYKRFIRGSLQRGW